MATTAQDKDEPSTNTGGSPTELAEKWEREIIAATKELKPWHTQSRKVVNKYLDKRGGDDAGVGSVSKTNLFWSNIQVLKAALYAKPPKVDVSNSFKDAEDDVSRVAGNILERMLNHPMEMDNSDFDISAKQAIGDYLIVGMGQMWYAYESEIKTGMTEPVLDQVGNEIVAAQEFDTVVSEDAPSEYIFWEDFIFSPCRTWAECRWAGKRVYMNRAQLIERFGEKIGRAIPIAKGNKKVGDPNQPQNDPWEKAQVYEIWDKTTKKVYWHAKGYDVILDTKDDPLGLEGFFPCPQPLMSNLTTSNLIPRADYVMAQDQYEQIDELTTRITYLTKACKVVGVYDKNSTGIGRVFQEGMENQMIPVDNWAAFAEKGGLKGQMDFVPVDQISTVIGQLTAQRESLKAALYEVLGIGDIMRGMTNPDETLGAQQLKAQFGGSRLQYKQMEIGQWVASGQRIRAQIICKHYQPKTIAERSNIMHSPDAKLADQGIQFLKDNGDGKRYRITIESETMAMIDWAQERDARTQFMQAVGSFVQAVTPLIQAQPSSAPIVLNIMKWGLGGFRVSKEIETMLDEAIQAAQQPQQPPTPTPMEQAQLGKVQSEAEKNKAQAQNYMADAGRNQSQAAENVAKTKGKHLENQATEEIMGAAPLPLSPLDLGAPPAPPPVIQ
jgi:hypothetical protein